MCQTHRNLNLSQEPLPGRTTIERHIRTRDVDLIAQVGSVTLHAIEAGEEISSSTCCILCVQLLGGGTLPLGCGRSKVQQFLLEGHRACCAARGAADYVLQRAPEGDTCRSRLAKHLILSLTVLDLPRLSMGPCQPPLQAAKVLKPLRHALATQHCEPLLESACGGGSAQRGSGHRVASLRRSSADECCALQLRIVPATDVHSSPRLKAYEHVGWGPNVLVADLVDLGRRPLRLRASAHADALWQVDDIKVNTTLR
mmetsp:Transcript_79338/g.204370  ORF Transcript_79338/g.204370 Transcript_79338/m.204370 type:complete len:256 (+) Transcript_79338:988-1755(+)